MANAFEEIMAGMEDAISHAKGESSGVIEHQLEAVDVKSIRKKTGMTQQAFCATFGISLGALRHWEQGVRSPKGTASVLLKVIDHDPQSVIASLS